ncbi:antitoxin VbhA family protein [Treponema primitia]|uniref:antitoxin VbhA family protein n=1 Tax=Treponema primitia TaxID=88058 RepID=UPI003980A965
MAYKPLEVDRQNLTIMGVRFPDLETLNRVSSAIGSNMFEGFEPTPALLEIYRDYSEGKISPANLVEIIQGVL